MKKTLVIILILFLSILVKAEDAAGMIQEVRHLEKEITRNTDKEIKYKKKLQKYTDRNDFISRARKQSYLNKLNKTHTELFLLNKRKRELLDLLKPILINRLREIESQIIQTTVEDDVDRLVELSEKYYDNKQLYDFYFQEKIDIILTMDEPADVKLVKLTLMEEKLQAYTEETHRLDVMIKKMEEQIRFLEESSMISNDTDDPLRDYLDFVRRTVVYLRSDFLRKREIMEFYSKQLQDFREDTGNE